MAPRKPTAGTKRQKKVKPIIQSEAQAIDAPITRKTLNHRLQDQKTHFLETIERRKQNLHSLERAMTALKIHLHNLQEVAANNETLIAEVKEDIQAKNELVANSSIKEDLQAKKDPPADVPIKEEKKNKKRTTRFRVSKSSDQQLHNIQA